MPAAPGLPVKCGHPSSRLHPRTASRKDKGPSVLRRCATHPARALLGHPPIVAGSPRSGALHLALGTLSFVLPHSGFCFDRIPFLLYLGDRVADAVQDQTMAVLITLQGP